MKFITVDEIMLEVRELFASGITDMGTMISTSKFANIISVAPLLCKMFVTGSKIDVEIARRYLMWLANDIASNSSCEPVVIARQMYMLNLFIIADSVDKNVSLAVASLDNIATDVRDEYCTKTAQRLTELFGTSVPRDVQLIP